MINIEKTVPPTQNSKEQNKSTDLSTSIGRVDHIVDKFNHIQTSSTSQTSLVHNPQTRGKVLQSHADLISKLDQNNIAKRNQFSYFTNNEIRRKSEPDNETIDRKSRKSSSKQKQNSIKLPVSKGYKLPDMVSEQYTDIPATISPQTPSYLQRSLPSPNSTFVFPLLPSPDPIELNEEIKVASLDRRASSSKTGRSFMQKLRKSSLLTASCDGPIPVNQNDPLDPNTVDFSKLVEDEDNNENEGGKSKKKKEKKKSKAPSRSSSDAKNSDKVRKFELLKKFLGRRPTFESLQERGIIKETVFGCPLKKLCEKERSSVPCFIQMCVKEVEKRGLDVDGIYRVSGNLSHVQKLRYLIDREEEVDLSDPEWEDIHIITGALKMFLRELPDPVIPFGFFDKFIAACKICNEEERFMTMKGLVSVLPKVNHDTLQYLLTHFKRVVEHSVENRMQVQNIAIVFGPTLLLKPPDASTTDPQAAAAAASGHMAVYMIYQNQIIDILLTEYQRIFGLKR